MANLSRGKRMVSLSLGLPIDEDTTAKKVPKWLHQSDIEKEVLETDFTNDGDSDYVPDSVGNGSDSSVSKTIPLIHDPFLPQQNRHTKAFNFCGGPGYGTVSNPGDVTVTNPGDVTVANLRDVAVTNPGDVTMTKNATMSMRMCKFCNEWQTHLKRHIVRQHPSEEEVIEALKLPEKDQMREFACMRKRGVYQQNVLLAEKGEELIRERKQGKSAIMMCCGCKGFYDKKTIFKHKRICCKSESSNPIGVDIQIPSDNARSLQLSREFMEQILNRFRKDEVGQLCGSDFLTLLLGKMSWPKSDKKGRHVIMSEMRLFANLILAFRGQSKNQSASGTDILDYSKFDTLEKAISQLSDNSEEIKNGLKVRLGFLLKRAVKVIRGYYLTQGRFKEEKAMTKFLNALHLQWDFIMF